MKTFSSQLWLKEHRDKVKGPLLRLFVPSRANREPKKGGPSCPRLPPDIQFIILSQLRDILFDALGKFLFGYDTFSLTDNHWAPSMASSVGPPLAAYHNAALAWGIPSLLYSYPVLISARSVQLFRRTIAEVAGCTDLVKDIIIVIPRLAPPKKSLLESSGPQRTPEEASADIAFILGSCTSLQSVLLRPSSSTLHSLTGGYLPPRTQSVLRSLTIHGAYSRLARDGESFAALETLCLRLFQFGSVSRLPPMPRLRTLKLCHTTGWSRTNHQLLPSDMYPSLESLYLYHNDLDIPPSKQHILSGFPRCKVIHLVGERDVSAFGPFMEAGALANVEHLTVGNIKEKDRPFLTWQPPQSLRTLNVLAGPGESITFRCLEAVCKWLHFNEMNTWTKVVSLRHVRVDIHEGCLETRTLEDSSVLMKLRDACLFLGIELSLDIINPIQWRLDKGELLSYPI